MSDINLALSSGSWCSSNKVCMTLFAHRGRHHTMVALTSVGAIVVYGIQICQTERAFLACVVTMIHPL